MVFDRDQNVDFKVLHQFIKNSSYIEYWWHYIKSGYIISTSKSISELADEIRKAFPSLLFLLLRTDISEFDGFLPQKAWNWLFNNSEKQEEYETDLSLEIEPYFKNVINILSERVRKSKQEVDFWKNHAISAARDSMLWEFNFLNYFLVFNTKRVLYWFSRLREPIPTTAFHQTWSTFIPLETERNTILDVLVKHNLIEHQARGYKITEKGKSYISFCGIEQQLIPYK
jgi:hypothetical protein